MSMICTLSRVTASQIAMLRGDPSAAGQLLHDPPLAVQAQPGFLARLLGKRPLPPARTLPWIGAAQQYELDGQWHIVHFLLTGESEGGPLPASFLCGGGGEELGRDFGFGKPRLFTSAETARIAAHLRSVREAELMTRYDAAAIEERDVYWQAAASPDEQREQVSGLHATMQEVADFAAETARLGCGLVVEVY